MESPLFIVLGSPYMGYPRGYTLISGRVRQKTINSWEVEVGYGIWNTLAKTRNTGYWMTDNLNISIPVTLADKPTQLEPIKPTPINNFDDLRT